MQSQAQNKVLETKHQQNMDKDITGGESVGIFPPCIITIVLYPALLLYHRSFKLVNSKVTKYTADNSYASKLLEHAVPKSVP